MIVIFHSLEAQKLFQKGLGSEIHRLLACRYQLDLRLSHFRINNVKRTRQDLNAQNQLAMTLFQTLY